jgi:hypothetical protein
MQTLEFTRALSEIVKELRAAEIVALLQPWLSASTPPGTPLNEPEKDRFFSLVLESHSGYDQLSGAPRTDRILKGLNVSEIYDPARLRRLNTFLSAISNVQQIRANGEFYGFFEILRSLQKFDGTCRTLLELEKVGKVEPTDDILELEFIDYDGNGIEPNRLARATEILVRLHMNLGRLLGVRGDKLTFKYFDSGSPLRVGIQAAKEIIATMGPLFLQFWDKIRFRDHDAFSRDMEALSKGLEFVTKVQEAVEKKAVTPEEAVNLKMRVFQGVNDLIGLGVTLPLRDTALDQRKLLIDKRDTKLLGTGQASDPAGDASTVDEKPS